MSSYSGSFSVHSDSVSQAYITQSATEEQRKMEKAQEAVSNPNQQSVTTTNTADSQTIQATYSSLVDNL